MIKRKIESLYIHIPFCDHICIYCDFYKMIAKVDEKERYITYLIKELHLKKDLLKNIKTVYLGGGTPSNLPINLLEKLFIELNKFIDLSLLKEFTIECNPIDINQNLINLIKKYHINRVSLGVQSFNDLKLSYLKRNHTKEIAINAIKNLQENDIYNINCDFIYGLNLKDQFVDNIEIIKNDLDIAISLNIPHISAYTLIIEDKTILNKFIKENKYQEMNGDIEADIYDYINQFLKDNNYQHYEVSNYALEGYQSTHNLTYWNNDYYLGLGANASYYYDNTRFTNINNLKLYYQGIDNLNLVYSFKEKLNKDDIMYEEVMLGLRKNMGVNKNNFFKRFNCDIISVYNNISKLIENKILVDDGENIFVREDKMYILNEILREILE